VEGFEKLTIRAKRWFMWRLEAMERNITYRLREMKEREAVVRADCRIAPRKVNVRLN